MTRESRNGWSRRDFLRTSVTAMIGALVARRSPARVGEATAPQKIWTFDRLEAIGGVPTRVEGTPCLIESPWGGAVRFDGVADALMIEEHPLAGATTFTFEAIFRPDGGETEQRWFHLAQDAPDKGAVPDLATHSRIMFEIRVVGEHWYLDAFTRGSTHRQALLFPDKLHPIGRWTHVAQTYDGRSYRSYVDGALQGEAEMSFTAQGPGRSSVGTRINRVNYFRGAVREARFTPRALAPADFTTQYESLSK